MYRKPGAKSPVFLIGVVLIGVVAGVVFFMNDQRPQPTSETIIIPTMMELPSATPVEDVSALATPTLIPAEYVQIVIPDAGVSAPIIHIPLNESGSWNVTSLGRNVGHLQGTAWVSEQGNIALAGHVEMADGGPGVFAHLRDLSAGSDVYLTMPGDAERIYSVESVRIVAPDDLSVLYPTTEDRLTLITCDSFDYLSFTYLERIVAIAARVQ